MKNKLHNRNIVIAFFLIMFLSLNIFGYATENVKKEIPRMSLFDSVMLGITEGVTEYLPVSSTGHLLVVSHFLKLDTNEEKKEASDAYAVVIQFGAILAVLWIYCKRILQIIKGITGRDKNGLKLFFNLCLAVAPAVIIGLLFEKKIKHYLFGMWPVAFAWFFGGIVILYFSYKMKKKDSNKGLSIDELTFKSALIIGLIQCFAMWPGVSRSLSVIIGGMIAGLSLASAVEFSFLLGLITLGMATGYEGLKYGKLIITSFGILNPLTGMIVAFICAFISVKWMVSYLNKHGLEIFGYYRIIISIIFSLMLIKGVM